MVEHCVYMTEITKITSCCFGNTVYAIQSLSTVLHWSIKQ